MLVGIRIVLLVLPDVSLHRDRRLRVEALADGCIQQRAFGRRDHDALVVARQQGFSGLEAEALFGEAVVTPTSDAANKATILVALRAAIAIASERGALPLKQKAEAMLNEMLAQDDRLS